MMIVTKDFIQVKISAYSLHVSVWRLKTCYEGHRSMHEIFKIFFVCVCVCLCVCFTSFIIPLELARMQALRSVYTFTKLIVPTRRPSNHLTSQSKSVLIQKPSAQIPKAFNQHGTAEKPSNYLGLNTLLQPIVQDNVSTKRSGKL